MKVSGQKPGPSFPPPLFHGQCKDHYLNPIKAMALSQTLVKTPPPPDSSAAEWTDLQRWKHTCHMNVNEMKPHHALFLLLCLSGWKKGTDSSRYRRLIAFSFPQKNGKKRWNLHLKYLTNFLFSPLRTCVRNLILLSDTFRAKYRRSEMVELINLL